MVTYQKNHLIVRTNVVPNYMILSSFSLETVTLCAMVELPKIRLFFLKSNSTDLTSVETYLLKRDYEVLSESDLKKGILSIIQNQPTYVFLAWDHPNEKIFNLPKIIRYSTPATTIIPFTLASSSSFIRKLDFSGYANRLYPPASGPSVVRLISKIEKEIKAEEADPNSKRKALSFAQAQNHKASSQEASRLLEQFLKELEEAAPVVGSQKPPYDMTSFNENQEKLKKQSYRQIDEKLKQLLQQKFNENIKLQIQDLATAPIENQTIKSKNNIQKTLCVIVQSSTWCGYLLVTSQLEINNEDYKTLIQNWLQDQLADLGEISPYDYFNVDLNFTEISEATSWLQKTADYLEVLEINDNTIYLSFFTLDPKHLLIEVSENHEMLEVALNIIEENKTVNFGLFLHLPENKKYILYTLANQSMQPNQKQRLLEKAVRNLYTPVEFETELKKLTAEKFLNDSLNKMKKDKN